MHFIDTLYPAPEDFLYKILQPRFRSASSLVRWQLPTASELAIGSLPSRNHDSAPLHLWFVGSRQLQASLRLARCLHAKKRLSQTRQTKNLLYHSILYDDLQYGFNKTDIHPL